MSEVGFTGTRNGMTTQQKNIIGALLIAIKPTKAHHGDCVGADADFDVICKELGIFTVGHPGVDGNGNSPHRAYCKVDEIKVPWPYLERNTHIVAETEILIAASKGIYEDPRSGTWSTIRKAQRKNRTIFVVYPDGRVGVPS